MSDFSTLRAAILEDAKGIMVDRLDLAELLAEVDALRGGAAKPASKYTAEFEEAWTLYPSRPGNAKAAAFKAWNTRLKQGATALEMIEGTRKYAVYCKTERKEGEFIKQAATFYGPGEHFTADWTPSARIRPLALVDQNAANNAEAMRLLGQPVFDPDDGMTLEAQP